MGFLNKLREVKDAVTDKFDDVKDFVEDKAFDAKYFVQDKASDVKDFVSDKTADAKYFIEDKALDAKYFMKDKVNIKSKADIVEAASYVLFPAQIPLKMIMSNVGKDSSANIQSKNNHLDHRIDVLGSFQKEGSMLNDKLNGQLKEITNVKQLIHRQLIFFAEVFEKDS